MKINIEKSFCQLYYSACGKPSKYRNRNNQVLDAYYLISILQGVNLFSIMFLIFAIVGNFEFSKALYFIIFCLPLILNYFLFLGKGKKKIIIKVDDLIKKGQLKPRSYLVKYFVATIIFMIIAASLYSLKN